MSRADKTLAQMKANPRDWRIEDLKVIADAFGVQYRQPGGSHVVFCLTGEARLSVPAHKPIKPVYVSMFVRLIEERGSK